MKKLLMILVMVSWCSVGVAEISVKKYLELKDENPDLIEINIAGIGSGFFWYDIAAKVRGKDRLYCLPKNFVLELDNYKSLLDSGIANRKNEGRLDETDAIAMIILSELQTTFPCK